MSAPEPGLAIQSSPEGVSFWIAVHPRSRRPRVGGLQGDALRVAVSEPPSEGRANEACRRALAGALGVGRGAVQLDPAARSRRKRVQVAGDAAALAAALRRLASGDQFRYKPNPREVFADAHLRVPLQGLRPRVRARAAHQRSAAEDLSPLQGAPGEAADLPHLLPPEGRRLVLGPLLEARGQGREEGRRRQVRLRLQVRLRVQTRCEARRREPRPERLRPREADRRLWLEGGGLSAGEGLRRTPLFERHVALGARIVEFGGFAMPVQYAGILAEHRAVREAAGLFDVSHMGQIHLRGPGALASVARLVTCPVASLRSGQVRYGLLCNEAGGVVDDVTVYRSGPEAFFLCVNASNVEKDYRWVVRHAGPGAEVRDRSAETGLLALQGPASAELLAALAEPDPRPLRRFRFLEGRVAGRAALVSRTGYTGSDGFEIYCAAADVGALWDALLQEGSRGGLVPAGLGARDTLRLEAALPLYGHELDDETSPLEAGLGRFVDPARSDFVGAEALRRQERAGLRRSLVGLVLEGRGVARAGYALTHRGADVGRVTSGAPSPTLGKSIALGYVPPALAAAGTELAVTIRGQSVAARVVPTPFVGKA